MSLIDLIPEAKSIPQHFWQKEDLESHVIEIIQGIVNSSKKGIGIYTHHFVPWSDELVFPDSECEKLVALFSEKGWELTYENKSTFNGTIKFHINRKDPAQI